jgi:hypothetical protein
MSHFQIARDKRAAAEVQEQARVLEAPAAQQTLQIQRCLQRERQI